LGVLVKEGEDVRGHQKREKCGLVIVLLRDQTGRNAADRKGKDPGRSGGECNGGRNIPGAHKNRKQSRAVLDKKSCKKRYVNEKNKTEN